VIAAGGLKSSGASLVGFANTGPSSPVPNVLRGQLPALRFLVKSATRVSSSSADVGQHGAMHHENEAGIREHDATGNGSKAAGSSGRRWTLP
jgi:hypothetical protein